ncbi:uncharacterized protein LOC144885111 [Branchiostoma floridae x Branchiostoma japonicum]
MAQYEPIPVSSLRDEVKERLTDMPEKEFNVLLVGVPGSGKSSFINSMLMAVTGTWKEVAHYNDSVGGSVTKCLKRNVMFDDNCKEVREPHPIPGYKQNVIFWDCGGFPNANEETYSTIVSLALDGRMPTGTKVVNCMDQSPQQLRRKFPKKVGTNTFDRIVFLHSADSDVPYLLVKAIKSGAKEGHVVPIVVVVTKVDKCPKQDLQKRVDEAKDATELKGNRVRFKTTSLYCEELTACPDPNDYRVMMPNEDIDRNLLNIWMSLTDPNIEVTPPEDEYRVCCII